RVRTMSDDYLWDPSAPPDPDVERLERLLAPLRTTHAAPRPMTRSPWTSARFLLPALATAAAIVAMIGVTWRTTQSKSASWEVTRTAGRPQIGSVPLAETGRLAVGDTLSTDATSRASLDVSTIGRVTIDENSRVRLLETREGRHHLALDRGSLHAV